MVCVCVCVGCIWLGTSLSTPSLECVLVTLAVLHWKSLGETGNLVSLTTASREGLGRSYMPFKMWQIHLCKVHCSTGGDFVSVVCYRKIKMSAGDTGKSQGWAHKALRRESEQKGARLCMYRNWKVLWKRR